MSSEREWQTKFPCQPGTKITGSEKPYRNVRAFPRKRMHTLRRLRFAKIPAQLVHKLWEIVAPSMQRTAQGTSRCGVAPGSAAEAQIDAARKERFESAKLF